MKIKFTLTAVAASCACAVLSAETLSSATAVQLRPDAASPVITVLKAGSEQPSLSTSAPPAPDGWTAVDVPGPFEAYVKNKDLTKALDVKEGAPVYLAPNDTAAVLETFVKGDKAEITGLHGKWTQIRLEKTLAGYIHAGAALAAAPAPAPVPAPSSPAPVAAPAPAVAGAGVDVSAADQNVALSRLCEGTLSTTRSLLSPRRPYDWQLLDPTGKRIAYVDLAKLLLTDQIENYAGHTVVVLGSLRPLEGTHDLVIAAEGFRLK